MGKVEVKQTPRRLNPYGEKLMKIWYDDSMPPKKYIWYKDEEYHFWNGEYWEPFELGDSDEGVNNKDNNNGSHNHGKCDNHCNYSCECCEEIKFEKFKKEVLAAVLRMVRGHEQETPEELEGRIEALEENVNALMQINHDLFVKNTELESLLEELGYLKEEDVAGLEVLSGLDERLNDIEGEMSSVRDNTANIRTLNNRLIAVENAGYITSDALSDYATKSYVDNAISNINIPTKVSDLENDNGFISEVNVELIDSEEEPIALANGDVINLVETATYNGDGNKIEINRRPYQINIETEEVEPFDPSALEERIGSVESDLDETKNDIAEFKQDTENKEMVISSAFNELNDRVANMDSSFTEFKEELNENLSDNELVISAAFNDLNDRVIDLNQRVSNLENEESGGDEPDPEPEPEPVDYVLTYDWNGGEEGPENVHSSEPTTVISNVEPTRNDGYYFDGWIDNLGNVRFGGQVITLPNTLTAQWAVEYPEGGMFTYQAPQAEDNAKLINNDESLTYDKMHDILYKMYNEGAYLSLFDNSSGFSFYPEPQGDDQTNIGLRCDMWTGESDEQVYAYLEQEEGDGFKFTLDRSLVEEVTDEETGESTYYQDIADGTEFNWSVSYEGGV